jgi:putative oxidoreductase
MDSNAGLCARGDAGELSFLKKESPMGFAATYDRVPQALFVLRVTLALFFAQWGVEKFIHPELAAAIFDHFYGLQISTLLSYGFGLVELVLAACLLFGVAKTVAYGTLIALHGITVVVSWRQLAHPWDAVPNHLFIASVPLLGALIALFLLRDHDVVSLIPAWMRGGAGSHGGAALQRQAFGANGRSGTSPN